MAQTTLSYGPQQLERRLCGCHSTAHRSPTACAILLAGSLFENAPELTPEGQNMQAGDVLGSYRIVRLLGAGGMGAVYEAIHTSIDRRVAIKVIHQHLAHKRDTTERFFNEARATNHIEHPSIIQVSDFGQIPSGAAYLVMEFLSGISLDKRLEDLQHKQERMDLASALQIGWQIADALTIAHANGIVHRDLKPENLMLIEDPVAPSGERVKILDFGIAKLTGNTPSTAQTAANAVLGSPRYMSPEQCAGAGGVDDKSDVYALGIILYEMLAGRRPFESQGVGELFLFHMTKEPDPLQVIAPSVPGEVARLVHKLLIKDKTLRPSMKQVQSELSNLLMSLSGSNFTVRRRASGAMAMADMRPSVRSGGATHTTLGESLGQSLRAASQSRTHLSILAVCAALVSVSLVFVLLRTRPQDRSEPKKVETTSYSPASKLPTVFPAKFQPTEQVKRVRWNVESEPSGAEIVDESGAKLGQTPWQSEREARQGASNIIVRKRGYGVFSVTLPHDRDVSQLVKLVVPAKTIPSKKKQKKQGKGLEIED